MKLRNVEILAGTKIFANKMDPNSRDDRVDQLNNGQLDCLIMTEGVGGCGHNMTGASLMIFTSSLYTMSGERQCTGMFNTNEFLFILGRMCRQGQLSPVVSAVIIADPNFKGDSAAFKIKDERAAEDHEMNRPLRRKVMLSVMEKVGSRLLADEPGFERMRQEEWRNYLKEKEKEKNRKKEEEKRERRRARALLNINSVDSRRHKLLALGRNKHKPLVV
jgi:hypothetical protein